jgi:Beta-lactamase class C and other penicillin binding proteins
MSTALPSATVALSGSATDSDTPAASLTFAWTSSNPGATTFSTPSAAATNATFNAAGSYTLTLTVGDGANSVADSLVVTVTDAATADVFPAPDLDDNDPFHGWTKVNDPATVGMTQAGLDAAAAFAQATPAGAGPGNGMIVRHGQLVAFWGDIDDSIPEVKSVTKSMGGIALGLAIDDAKLALTDKASAHLPTIGIPPDVNGSKGVADITIAQLATHTAGFPKPGGYAEIPDSLLPIGSKWSYSDGGLNWLADTLTETYGQDLSSLLNTRVWSVIGLRANDVRWRTMAGGFRPDPRPSNPTLQYRELASGIQTNVNAMARVGLLFLRKGMWNGQRVLSESFVQQVHTPLPQNAGLQLVDPTNFPGALTDYGVLWWTNTSGQMTGVPADTYWAWGLGEALIVVIPSLDLVIARNGGQANANSTPGARVWNDDFWNADPRVIQPFIKPIVDATTP